jgi:exonuclease VII large subunit
MADIIPLKEESDPTADPTVQKTAEVEKKLDPANPTDGEGKQKSNQDFALERLSKEKDEMRQRVADLEAQLKETSRSQLSDEDQLEAELKDLTTDRIFSTLGEEIKQLPERIQKLLEKNPWHFVDQADLDQELKGSKSRVEAYRKAEKLAVRAIKDLTVDLKPADPTKDLEPKKDPTIPIGGGQAEGTLQYTEAELWVLRQTEPEKFKEVQRTLKKMSSES